MNDQPRVPASIVASRRSGLRRLVVVLLAAVTWVLVSPPATTVSGPRPPLGGLATPIAGRDTSPPRYVGADFVTLGPLSGDEGIWRLSPTVLPLRFRVERNVVERYGADAVRDAVAVWNGLPGSRFSATAATVTDSGIARRARDGVSRIFLDRHDCDGRYLARAHIWRGVEDRRTGTPVTWVTEVDIGICERLDQARFASVLRHELGHVAGLGHLCDAGAECWTPVLAEDNRCRVMNPAAYACQELAPGDVAGLRYLYPALPRVGAEDPAAQMAAVSYLLHPRPRAATSVIATAADAPLELQLAAARLAGHRHAPHLLIDDACTEGPGGRELNRVAAVGAEVVLVGDVDEHCLNELRYGWELEVRRLPSGDDVTTATVEALPEPPRRLVLAPAVGDGEVVPSAALGSPVAVHLGAPLITVPRGDAGPLRRWLSELPSVTGIIALPGALPDDQLAEVAAAAEVRVRPLTGSTPRLLTRTLADMRDVYPTGALQPVAVADDRPRDAAAGVTLAVRLEDGLLLPADPEGPGRISRELLGPRAASGYVVGPPSSLSHDAQGRLSAALDGAE